MCPAGYQRDRWCVAEVSPPDPDARGAGQRGPQLRDAQGQLHILLHGAGPRGQTYKKDPGVQGGKTSCLVSAFLSWSSSVHQCLSVSVSRCPSVSVCLPEKQKSRLGCPSHITATAVPKRLQTSNQGVSVSWFLTASLSQCNI